MYSRSVLRCLWLFGTALLHRVTFFNRREVLIVCFHHGEVSRSCASPQRLVLGKGLLDRLLAVVHSNGLPFDRASALIGGTPSWTGSGASKVAGS